MTTETTTKTTATTREPDGETMSRREASECGLSRLAPNAAGEVSDFRGVWRERADGGYEMVRRHVYRD